MPLTIYRLAPCLKMYAKDGATILLESFTSLQGILFNPVAFFRFFFFVCVSSWFKSLHTVLALGGLREKYCVRGL